MNGNDWGSVYPSSFIPHPCDHNLSARRRDRRLSCGLGVNREDHFDTRSGGNADLLRLRHLVAVLAPGGPDIVSVPTAGRERGRIELADRAGGSRRRVLEPEAGGGRAPDGLG